MSNTPKRPPLARKVTPKSEKNRRAELDQGITLIIDGREYTVRVGDLTGLDDMALRREVGLPFPALVEAMQDKPGADLIAALMWLARRIEGERTLRFEEVAAEVGYDLDIDVKEPGAESNPEA